MMKKDHLGDRAKRNPWAHTDAQGSMGTYRSGRRPNYVQLWREYYCLAIG